MAKIAHNFLLAKGLPKCRLNRIYIYIWLVMGIGIENSILNLLDLAVDGSGCGLVLLWKTMWKTSFATCPFSRMILPFFMPYCNEIFMYLVGGPGRF